MNTELRRLGKYELRERLASGGQGVVWKAFDTQLQRFVAIKQLNAHLQSDPDSIERFEREAQFVASLRHANIVPIHDFQFVHTPDADTSTAYMVMDYIEGPTLAEYIRKTSRKGQFPSASDIVYIFTAVGLALDYAHHEGMIHRDIKPANIMLDKRNPHGRLMGEPVLMDFGIAKLQGGYADTTRVLGTPLYVSPEQAQGLSGDKRSDLYSLGVILYEVMTGRTPFYGESTMAILMQHWHAQPTLPFLINPHISPDLSAVILRSIAKDPEARFSSASAMTIALAEVLSVPIPPELRKTGAFSAPTVMANEPDATTPSYPPSEMTLASASPAPVVAPSFFSPPTFISSANDQRASIQPSGKRPGKKRLYIVSIILLALLALGLASYALLVPKTPPVVDTVVGQVHFRSSQNTAGVLDEVQLSSLKDIPDGGNYYVWLETRSDSIVPVHWSVTARNGNLSPSSYIDPQQRNLLTSPQVNPPYRLLITRQDTETNAPSFDPSERLYYALIPQTESAIAKYSVDLDSAFDIKPCPSGDVDNPCMS